MGTSGFFIGIVLSLIASTMSNLGVNVQKYSQLQNNKRPLAERKPYTKQPIWWGGLANVILGAILDFGALSFAPQAVVMPVGSFTLVANVLFAHYCLGEALGRSDVIGTCFIVLGATTIAIAYGALGSGEETDTNYTAQDMRGLYERWTVLAYGITVLLLLAGFILILRRCEQLLESGNATGAAPTKGDKNSGKGPTDDTSPGGEPFSFDSFFTYDRLRRLHPLSYAAVSGIFGSFSVAFGKSIGLLLGHLFGGDAAKTLGNFYFWIALICLVVTILLQTHFLALGLKYFDALFIVPVFQCFFITLSILGGAIYWKETDGFTTVQWVVFLLGVVLVLWGVFLMSSRDMAIDGVEDSSGDSEDYAKLVDATEDPSSIDAAAERDVRLAATHPTPLKPNQLTRRSTAASFVRPFSLLRDPKLRRFTKGNRYRGPTMGLLPVIVNADDDDDAFLGFGLTMPEFEDPFSLHNRLMRKGMSPHLLQRLNSEGSSGSSGSDGRRHTMGAAALLQRQRSPSDSSLLRHSSSGKVDGILARDVTMASDETALPPSKMRSQSFVF